MPRIDDYVSARQLAVDALAQKPAGAIAERCGFQSDSDGSIQVPFLDRAYRIHPESYDFRDSDAPEQDVPLQEQIDGLLQLLTNKETLSFVVVSKNSD